MRTVKFGDLLAEPLRNGVYKSKEFHGSGTRLINMKELFAHDFLSNQAESRIRLSPAELSKSKLLDGDLLFARRSFVLEGAGKCSLIVEPTEDTTFESSMIRARPHRDLADPRFLYYYFKSAVGRSRMASIAARTAVSGITGSSLSALTIEIPGVREQRRVSELLAQFDYLIENNQRRAALVDQMARAIYREWFVNFRYPGRARVDSSLGSTPEGWQTLPLFEAAEVGFGFSFKSSRFSSSGPYQLVRIRDILSGVSSTFTDEPADPRYAVVDDDLLIGMDGDFHVALWTGDKAWLNQRVARLRPLAGLSPLHLKLAIEGQIVAWNKAIVGTTVAHLGKKHLESVNVVVPDPELLTKATGVFAPLMRERRSLEQMNRRLRSIRDTLLPRLVTGQIKVSRQDLDELVEAPIR